MQDILSYAKKYRVPIIQKPSLDFLIELIKRENIQSVLEIGTAIGYSAINMALAGATVYSIEKNYDHYCTAFDNVRKFNLQDKIQLIYSDAFLFHSDRKFDLLFIDGAKAQSIAFLEQFRPCLNPGGFIFVDNINFHDLTYTKEKLNRDLNQLTRKIRLYVDYVTADEGLDTQILNIGDGIAVSKLKF